MAETLDITSMSSEQAYSDMLPRIKALELLSGEDLASEMKLLKKALVENPNACLLMLPEDIGQMVSALRKITGQALAVADAKPKKGEAKPKKLALTAEAMQAAFDEL